MGPFRETGPAPPKQAKGATRGRSRVGESRAGPASQLPGLSDGAALFALLESVVTGPDLVYDLDGDEAVTINDVRIFFVYRATGAPPGPGALYP